MLLWGYAAEAALGEAVPLNLSTPTWNWAPGRVYMWSELELKAKPQAPKRQ